MSTLDAPIPLSDLESVLAWVDTFKLSRQTKKINRDFSDAVLLAEILSVHYPKLVEMHNYPPRNSHALKLNNWMTLNRKVLKKLKLNLCCSTMDQLANAAPGLIERVLLMVRDKIRRDEEQNKSVKDSDQNVSSGGSYYEACGDEENVLVVPVKTRVNGVLETVQQKVVSYDSYQALKEELKDAKDSLELLRQKVEHLDSLLKLKDERIDELQKQLDRKQARRKEAEAFQNSLAVPFETVQSPVVTDVLPVSKKPSVKTIESATKIPKMEESRIPVPKVESSVTKLTSKPSITEVSSKDINSNGADVERIKSDVFKEVEIVDVESHVNGNNGCPQNKDQDDDFDKDSLEIQQENEYTFNETNQAVVHEMEEFKDSEQHQATIITIEETIHKEIVEIIKPNFVNTDLNYFV